MSREDDIWVFDRINFGVKLREEGEEDSIISAYFHKLHDVVFECPEQRATADSVKALCDPAYAADLTVLSKKVCSSRGLYSSRLLNSFQY